MEKRRPEAAAPRAEVAERAADAPEVRASDADRDRVADILREALAEGRLDAEEHSQRLDAVYAAKTVGELRPLVRDLPAQPGHEADVRPAPQAAPPAAVGGSRQDNLIGIFAGSVRKGRYRVPPRINAVAVFGGVEIDLTEAVFEHQQVVITAVAVFGGVEIKVPENVTLQHKGAGVFGGFDVRVQEADEPGAPVVLVQGAAVFGGVEAKPKRGKRLRDLHRTLHRRDRKEL
ncbi:DUF1707 domain-containing protein [Streptomyces sp. ODS28]|uniref:DUF1707 SHOCT-like domain-containing protein n=1 Tax=Streptomyces sp. ODS28 TaxID=3136688 RepID=UPI0031EEEF9C